MRVCPRCTRGFISSLQSHTREGPSNLHTWDSCMSNTSRGSSPTATPHMVTQAATVLSALSISRTRRCNCERVNTGWRDEFYSLVCPSLQKRDTTPVTSDVALKDSSLTKDLSVTVTSFILEIREPSQKGTKKTNFKIQFFQPWSVKYRWCRRYSKIKAAVNAKQQ